MLSIINNLELNEKYKEKLLENLKLFICIFFKLYAR